MDSSILSDIKKLLMIPDDNDSFDIDLIIYINTVFTMLNQMGIGPDVCFSITDGTAKWSDFTTRKDMACLKTYVMIKVKMLFDPPSNSQLTESYNNTAAELEYRMQSITDHYLTSETDSVKNWAEGNA